MPERGHTLTDSLEIAKKKIIHNRDSSIAIQTQECLLIGDIAKFPSRHAFSVRKDKSCTIRE